MDNFNENLKEYGQDGAMRLWDIVTIETVATIRIPKKRILSIDFSPDGRLLATGSSDGLIRVWNISEVLGR